MQEAARMNGLFPYFPFPSMDVSLFLRAAYITTCLRAIRFL